MKTIRILGTAIPGLTPEHDVHAGCYVQSFQLDLDPTDPVKGLVTSESYDDALKFETTEEAIAFWQQASVADPVRHDGKPNRPLTMFTVAIE